MHPLAATTFVPYGPYHWAALVGVGLAAWAFIAARRRLPTDAKKQRLDRSLGWFTLAQWTLVQALELLPTHYDVTRSLPINICDLAGLMAAVAMLTGARAMRALLYYWAFVLSSMALILPELREGPTHMNFWFFWVPHAMIIALAVYDVVGRGFRPAWRDFAVAYAAILVYLGLILLVDVPWNLNYGYVGRDQPGGTHPMGFLGDWPGRIFKAAVAVAAAMAVLTVPFTWRRKKAAGDDGKPAAKASPGRRAMVDGLEDRISV